MRRKDELGNGYYCEDCDRIMDSRNYGDHNVDHTVRPIVWEFLARREARTLPKGVYGK